MPLPGALLSPSSKKKSNLRKFLIFQEIEISYIFSRENCFYISGNGNPEKFPYIFSKESFSNISGNGNP